MNAYLFPLFIQGAAVARNGQWRPLLSRQHARRHEAFEIARHFRALYAAEVACAERIAAESNQRALDLSAFQTLANGRAERIDGLKKIIDGKDREIAEYKEVSGRMYNEIDTSRQTIQAQQNEIAALQEQLANESAKVNYHNEISGRQSDEIAALKAEIAALKKSGGSTPVPAQVAAGEATLSPGWNDAHSLAVLRRYATTVSRGELLDAAGILISDLLQVEPTKRSTEWMRVQMAVNNAGGVGLPPGKFGLTGTAQKAQVKVGAS